MLIQVSHFQCFHTCHKVSDLTPAVMHIKLMILLNKPGLGHNEQLQQCQKYYDQFSQTWHKPTF